MTQISLRLLIKILCFSQDEDINRVRFLILPGTIESWGSWSAIGHYHRSCQSGFILPNYYWGGDIKVWLEIATTTSSLYRNQWDFLAYEKDVSLLMSNGHIVVPKTAKKAILKSLRMPCIFAIKIFTSIDSNESIKTIWNHFNWFT